MTTPQPAAQEVASRAAVMAQKTNMRLLGVVENMSGEVFGSGGGDRLAAELGIPLLGRVPLDPRLREQGDLAVPLVEAEPDVRDVARDRPDRGGGARDGARARDRDHEDAAPRLLTAGAFFDLDRTLLRRSSALALAGSFRERGLISRRQVAQAARLAAPLRRPRRARRGGRGAGRARRRRPARSARRGGRRARRRRDGAGAEAAARARGRRRGARVPRAGAPRLHRLDRAAGDRGRDRRRPRPRRRDRHGLRGGRRPLHRPRAAAAPREGEGGGARASSPSASRSISPPRPRTPTATPTCRSSRRSAIPSSSIRTVRCGRSRSERGWPILEARRRAA